MKIFISYIVFILILVNCFNLLGDDIQIVSKTQVFDFSQGSEIYTPNKGVFTSDVIKAEIPFTDVGIHWKANYPAETKIVIKIRTSKDGKSWTKWKKVLIESYPNENPKSEFFSNLICVDQNDKTHEYIQYRVKLIPNEKKDTPILEKISFTFIEAGITPSNLLNEMFNLNNYNDYIQSSQSSLMYPKPNVVSRSGWGADESLMTWPPNYTSVTHNIIHHTDTPNTDTNWALRIRSIYYYHAVTQGWGDIGYNYLVDPNGVLYEGRYGGDEVEGAHAYGYNDGSVGFAFLGSYGGGTYGGNTTPSAIMLASGERLLAWKCSQKNISPLGLKQARFFKKACLVRFFGTEQAFLRGVHHF